MHEFKSSFLKGCSYDEEKQELTVFFQNGKEYPFADVSKEIYEEFKDAESPGKYFGAYIKGKYQAPSTLAQDSRNDGGRA